MRYINHKNKSKVMAIDEITQERESEFDDQEVFESEEENDLDESTHYDDRFPSLRAKLR